MSGEATKFRLEPVGFDQLPGWAADDPSALLPAIADCLDYLTMVKPYRPGQLGLTAQDLVPLLEKAAALPRADGDALRHLLEVECQVFRIARTDGKPGFVTAFYEPDIEVSDHPDDLYRFPFYRRPDDLIDLDDQNRPGNIDPSYVFGRKIDDGVTYYPDRQAIDQGFLEGRGLEIAWAKSKVDVFFVHVQGAARLRYADGRVGRITYAAKAGHPFSGIGGLLLKRGEISAEAMSMQAIRAWLASHPDQVDDVLWYNRSYIFFREAEVGDLLRGPIAAAKVPLVAGRSLAVDRTIHTFGFPFFIHSQTLTSQDPTGLDNGKPFARLMLALDTGSAIVGPARGDIFTGSGDEAGNLAGAVRNDADFYILIPKQAAKRVESRFG
ncbi:MULTISPECIES: murein transglycosylase A [Rhizobium/Agrobacterium group]|uniref:murein transglycosylase A n=1 Tax=Rhizobium/Agrobacterium group TaxID=227290 RepID=UPI000B406080|nr:MULTISPECIES: murein transglycosylase A [Rhizobium/Agrobacterium group]MCF1484719.1 transglycosylase [Allorhizobium ampelinum]NSZ44330.1 murein transglycosylase A [Agrobacterium vitis]NTA28077.1 murein transglycosylase A [Allorhizobium ampelinum]OVE93776.1 transglycosylase [Allorhizobium ampelinum]